MNIKLQLLSPLSLLLLLLFHCTTTLAQSPAKAPTAATTTKPQPPAPAAPTPAPAPAPASAASVDIIKILKKAGHFTLLIRLMKNTQVGDQINSQLQTATQGLTIFAPTDGAFSSLKSGTLNSLTDVQQVKLLQYHILPTYLTTSHFQTASNPLRTQAGDTGNYGFPLNITTSGNQVNVSTGIVNATVTDTLYSDNQLAVYEVDKVLLPLNIFGPKPPASAPAPAPAEAPASSKPKTKSPALTVPTTDTTSGSTSLTISHGLIFMLSLGVATNIAAFCFSSI